MASLSSLWRAQMVVSTLMCNRGGRTPQIADRQSLQMPSPWCMTFGDLGVRPPQLHISVLTTICARHKLDKLAVLPVIEAFAFTHPCVCSTIPSRSSSMHWRQRVGIRFALVSAGGVLFGCFGSRGFLEREETRSVNGNARRD